MLLHVYGDNLCAWVSAAALASTGNQVVLHLLEPPSETDVQAGNIPFSEPGLAALVTEQVREQRLRYADFAELPGEQAALVFLALQPDKLAQAQHLVERLAGLPARHWLLVNQSTFPVGSTEALQQRFCDAAGEGASLVAVSFPDLLQEGAALQNFTRPTHLIVGCEDRAAEALVREVLRPFNRRKESVLVMRAREAEFTKLAINGMLATRLSFMNDMANVADVLGVDIEKVRVGVGSDARIGEAYLYPGCGFGGLSFSRDLMILEDTLKASGAGSELLHQVLMINEKQKEVLFRKLWQHYRTDIKGKKVAVWGAAFKPGTHRIDNAPVLRLIDTLLAQQVEVHVHDPRALPTLHKFYGERAGLFYHDDQYAAVQGADALMLVTEWKSYWQPDFARLRAAMRSPLILDGRNIYGPAFVRSQGFTYHGVGRGTGA